MLVLKNNIGGQIHERIGRNNCKSTCWLSDEVVVSETENEREILITLHVASDDMGKVIGKQGRIAKAIRSVVKAASSKSDKKVKVEIQ